MKRLILALAFVGAVALPMTAAADYTTIFGNTYTDAQVAQFCAALRPGSAAYIRHGCN
jgi:hypothetical protein